MPLQFSKTYISEIWVNMPVNDAAKGLENIILNCDAVFQQNFQKFAGVVNSAKPHRRRVKLNQNQPAYEKQQKSEIWPLAAQGPSEFRIG